MWTVSIIKEQNPFLRYSISLMAGHESGNTGDTTIDLVWITLK